MVELYRLTGPKPRVKTNPRILAATKKARDYILFTCNIMVPYLTIPAFILHWHAWCVARTQRKHELRSPSSAIPNTMSAFNKRTFALSILIYY
jgi:hypothetical protein